MPSVFQVFGVWAIISLPVLPRILSIFLVMNNTDLRPMIEKIMPKYFVNQDDYFYSILVYANAVICIGGTTMVATGMMLIAYLKHACGMFKVAR